jgi:hypothetical protein
MVRSQIANLTPDPSFVHNLCFRCLDESRKPVLDICVLRAFQWYKELFNPMCFGPCNHFLKIRGFIETPSPKVGVHLGVWRFNSHTFHTLNLLGAWNVISGFHSWHAPLKALALVASPRLGLRHEHTQTIATLALVSRPRQGLAKMGAKNEAQESHFMFMGVWESVREWTFTLLSELPFWELESWWSPEFSESNLTLDH